MSADVKTPSAVPGAQAQAHTQEHHHNGDSSTGSESVSCQPPKSMQAEDPHAAEGRMNECPSPEELKEIGELPVQDDSGNKVSFADVVKKDGTVKRNLVIFVRHFFCGNCQEYLKALSSDIPPSSLPQGTTITIIGCGSSSLLAQYRKNTKCAHTLYTDSTQNLYKALDLGRTLAMADNKPEYMKSSIATTTIRSIGQVFKSGMAISRAGDWWQIGGEFLFEVDDGEKGEWRCVRAHRMQNTMDHAEIKELKGWLALS